MQLTQSAVLARNRTLIVGNSVLALALLVMLGLAIRLPYGNEPPLNFHATRQYRSLLIARGFFAENAPAMPEWQREVAAINMERQGILEPPLMERLVATVYGILGREAYWVPRLFSSLFWLVGGLFLYGIGRRVAGEGAALFSVAFYLFLPFAVVASRSFQPDPLMVMLMLASIYGFLRYDERPSTRRLGAAAATSALACFVKPIALFVLFGIFVSLAIHRRGVRGSFLHSHFVLYSAVILLPVALFYIYGIFIAGFLQTQAQSSFLPQILVTPFFWRGWLLNIEATVGFTAFVLALLGCMLLRPGLPRALLLGWWAGYVAFCLTFNYHIATHDYYHLQLVPLVALSLGPLVPLLVRHLLRLHPPSRAIPAVMGLASLALLLSVALVPGRLSATGAAGTVRVAEEIGAHVGHSTSTVFLAADYGLSLEYHGQLSGKPWPLLSDLEWGELAGEPLLPAPERFQAWFAADAPEYFIVVDSAQYEGQPDLVEFLTGSYPVLVATDDYLIWDLRP
jgi:hypothetical protein